MNKCTKCEKEISERNINDTFGKIFSALSEIEPEVRLTFSLWVNNGCVAPELQIFDKDLFDRLTEGSGKLPLTGGLVAAYKNGIKFICNARDYENE